MRAVRRFKSPEGLDRECWSASLKKVYALFFTNELLALVQPKNQPEISSPYGACPE